MLTLRLGCSFCFHYIFRLLVKELFTLAVRKVFEALWKNSVKVLATIFLFSFRKLICAVIATVLFTNVKSYNGKIYKMSVWLLDANVHYLYGKHKILFVAACVAGTVAVIMPSHLPLFSVWKNSRKQVWVDLEIQVTTRCLYRPLK